MSFSETVRYDVDICVYGATSSGVVAAYSAKKMGKTVLLVEPGKYLGGMTTSGLGSTDVGHKEAITGLSRLFYRRVGEYYKKKEEWSFSPSVATKVIQRFVNDENLTIEYQRRIVSAQVSKGKITEIILENSLYPQVNDLLSVKAKIFIDCTYEGDLMARAGVSYFTGREDNSLYGETLNGVQLAFYHQFPDGVDPYKVEGDSTSGLCWGVSNESFGKLGMGDKSIQAYNYRLCLTKKADNRRPFEKPQSYNREHYELLARALKKMDLNKTVDINSVLSANVIAEGKYDVNNRGAMSTNMIGMNYEYPEGSYEKRAEICKLHQEYIKGLFYFLISDESVPEVLSKEVNSFGWAKDEFTDNDNFPPQIYVREARRLNGEYIMTQKNCEGTIIADNAIGMGSYAMDSHNCRRIIINGMVKNEGDVEVVLANPYPISYYSIVPKRNECQNLLVPVCISSTHIAYGSIRMEPVFMVLGQSAGIAASMAIDSNSSVQEINILDLQKKLKTDPFLDENP